MVQDKEEEELELGPMSRRRTWDGIPQRPHPKVRHGEVPIARTDVAKGVMTSSLSMNPRIGKSRGT